MQMDKMIRDQILDDFFSLSHDCNSIGKGMLQSVLLWANYKIDGIFLKLSITTSLGEGKL